MRCWARRCSVLGAVLPTPSPSPLCSPRLGGSPLGLRVPICWSTWHSLAHRQLWVGVSRPLSRQPRPCAVSVPFLRQDLSGSVFSSPSKRGGARTCFPGSLGRRGSVLLLPPQAPASFWLHISYC